MSIFKRKNLIIYGYNKKNLGDDLMFAEIINKTNYENYYFMGEALVPNFVNKKVQFIRRGRLMPLRWKAFSDFAIIGGSVLMGTTQIQQQLIIRKRNWFLLNKIWGGRNFIVGANLGPFDDKGNYLKLLTKLSKLTDKWLVRDQYSHSLLNEIEVKNSYLMPDIVMGFDTKISTSGQKQNNSTPYICISVTNVDKDGKGKINSTDYLQEIRLWIKQAISNRQLVKFVSFEDSLDVKVIDSILELLEPDMKDKVETVLNKDNAVLEALAGAEFLISTRFHCMVLGALFKKPQIIYSYSSKTSQFAANYSFTTYPVTGDIVDKLPCPTEFPISEIERTSDYARLLEE